MAKSIIDYSIGSYLKNIKFNFLFSIPALIGLLILLFVRIPTYPAIGSIYLRTGSIPDITALQWGVLIISYLVSLFLISFAIVSLNLVIKSERTLTNIGKEVMRGIEKYVLNVFWIYLTATLLLLIVQLFTYELKVQQLIFPILSFVISLFVFYAPAGLVIDDARPGRAIEKSIQMIISKLPNFLMWLAIAFVLLSIPDFIFLTVLSNSTATAILSATGPTLASLPSVLGDGIVFLVKAIFSHELATTLLIVLNSLFILPFLIVLQTQIYISKYTIL